MQELLIMEHLLCHTTGIKFWYKNIPSVYHRLLTASDKRCISHKYEHRLFRRVQIPTSQEDYRR